MKYSRYQVQPSCVYIIIRWEEIYFLDVAFEILRTLSSFSLLTCSCCTYHSGAELGTLLRLLVQLLLFGGAQIKKSHHSLINPAITITLRSGSGGQGVPPLVSADGILPHPGFFWAALSRLFLSFSLLMRHAFFVKLIPP